MTYLKADDFAQLYRMALDKVYNSPDYESAPRGLKIKECLDVVMEIENPLSNLFKCEDKSATLATGYIKKEICLYLKATDSVDEFAKASPFWKSIANPDGKTINSAYGNLIFNKSLADGRSQFDWATESLLKDKDSRQAFIRFNNTAHQFDGNRDLPCTFYMIFHIRDNKLHATVDMRSNDIIKGLAYDVPSFTLFQWLMLLRLREKYSDLEIGTYTHSARSLHIYQSDFELVEKRLANKLIPNSFPMPEDWKVIKSDDIEKIADVKLNKQMQLFYDFHLSSNQPFYDWLLS